MLTPPESYDFNDSFEILLVDLKKIWTFFALKIIVVQFGL